MTKRIFSFENLEGQPQHTVKEVKDEHAQRIIEQGKGIEVDFGQYDEYKQQATGAYDEYKKKIDEVKASDNPLHTDEYKAYEIAKIEQQYERQKQDLQYEWSQVRQQMVDEAKRKAATSTVKVTEADRQLAEQLAARHALNIRSATSGDEAKQALSEAEQAIKHLTDGQKVALQSKMDGLLTAIESRAEKFGKVTKGINAKNLVSNAQDVRDLNLLSGKVSDQLPRNINGANTRQLVQEALSTDIRRG